MPHYLPRISRALWLLVVFALALAPHAFAAPPGKTLLDKVKDAYAKIDTYEATDQIHSRVIRKGKAIEHKTTTRIAYDRKRHRLLIDNGEARLVVDQGELLMKTKARPGVYLKITAPKPLTYEAVSDKVRLTGVACPDLVMLLDRKPLAFLSSGCSRKADTVELPNQHPGLRFASPLGPMTLTVDRKTFYVAQQQLNATKTIKGVTGLQVSAISKPTLINKPLPPNTFTFKIQGLKAITSVKQFRKGFTQPAHPPAAHAMAGALAKPIALPKLKLTDPQGKHVDLQTQHATPVIVLSFWASWSNDCVQKLLPMTEHLHDWASKQHKDIAIYAVDMGEAAKEVARFWKQKHYKVPLLLDEQVQAGTALNIDSIPCIVVIVDGKVRIINDNLTPKTEANLKTTLTDLLNQAATTSQTPKGLD